MSEVLPKYKQLKISLRSKSDVSVKLYSDYENLDFEQIYETDEFIIEGVPADPNKKSELLFEYNQKKDEDKEKEKYVFEKIRLYETKEYIVSFDDKAEVTLTNEKEFEPKRTAKNQLSFKVVNYLGKSAINIKVDEKTYSFPFEIVPLKIDYEEDYVKLTEDIACQCSALLLDYASPTNLSFHADFTKKQESPLEKFIFIRQFCSSENIEYLFQSIKNNPDRHLVTEEVMKPFGTAPISKKFFSNPFTYGKNFVDDGNGDYIPDLVSSTRKYDSFDTPANRFVRFALHAFSDVCQDVIEKLPDGYSYKDEAELIKNQIETILYDPFFDDVQLLTSMPYNNQVLQKREGYAQIFNAFNMLDIAMQLDWKGEEEIYKGQARNIALLYEYWLVFKFMEILQNIGAEIKFDISDEVHKNKMFTKDNGLLISLKEGKTSYYEALIIEKRLKINFYYNRTFKKKDFEGTNYKDSYSRPFRPDYTIVIFPSSYDEEQAIKKGEASFIHFDAKYRVTDITSLFGKDSEQIIADNSSDEELSEEKENEIINEYFSEEKKSETINTYNRGDLLKMHTYNDAIRKTIGSYVLYPGKTYGENNFSVYDELLPGVGAFAIRPGEEKVKSNVNGKEIEEGVGEKAIREFIEKVIDFKFQSESRLYRKDFFENSIIHGPSKEKESIRMEVNKKEYVLCGMIRKDYLNYLNDKENVLQKHYLPKSEEDTAFELKSSDSRLLFYYHAIKDGAVYSLHPNTNEAKYFCGTETDLGKNSEIILQDWTAEIEKTELVSKDELIERLKENSGYELKNPKADFYYLVTLKDIKWKGIEIAGKTVNLNEDVNNMLGSPYSPKIISKFYLSDKKI